MLVMKQHDILLLWGFNIHITPKICCHTGSVYRFLQLRGHLYTNSDASKHAEGIVGTYPPHTIPLWALLLRSYFPEMKPVHPLHYQPQGIGDVIRRLIHLWPDNNKSKLLIDINSSVQSTLTSDT